MESILQALIEEVPVQAEGQFVWPAGQPMNPTPNDIFFQVKNPDGTKSNFVQAASEIQATPEMIRRGKVPTPVLTEITPARIVAGSINPQIVLRGRNFTTDSRLFFQQTDEITELSGHFVNDGEISVTLPNEITSQPQSWFVKVVNGGLESRSKQLKIVIPGLPNAPELTTLEPSQLPSSLNPTATWITLRGSNFIDGDSVVIANTLLDKMQTEFVSENEIRALVPRLWQAGPGLIDIHVESAQDSDLMSGDLTLEILNTVNIVLSTPPRTIPFVTVVNDGYIPVPPFGTKGNIPVEITGVNFELGSTVEAVIGNKAYEFTPHEITETSMTFYVPVEILSIRTFRTSLLLIPAQVSSVLANLLTNSVAAITDQRMVTFDCPGEVCWKSNGYHLKLYKDESIPNEFYVMLPKDGTKEVIAKMSNIENLDNGIVHFKVSDSNLVNISPVSSQNPEEMITATGIRRPDPDRTIALTALNTEERVLGKAQFYIMPRREYNVTVHFIRPEIDPENEEKIDPKGSQFIPQIIQEDNPAEAVKVLLDKLNEKVNKIWTPQTNVKFNFISNVSPESILKTVKYTDRLTSGLQYPNIKNMSDPEYNASYDEVRELMTKIGSVRPGELAPEIPDSIHLYFVTNFINYRTENNEKYPNGGEPADADGFAIPNQRQVFIPDSVFSKNQVVATIAHELGHSLGLVHTELLEPDNPPVEYNSDEVTLMWGEMWGIENVNNRTSSICYDATDKDEGFSNCNHIGYAHWKQLNESQPENLNND